MRLAIIDPEDRVLLAWPTTADAHTDIADQLAASIRPGRFRRRQRAKLAAQVRTHLLELQAQTIRL